MSEIASRRSILGRGLLGAGAMLAARELVLPAWAGSGGGSGAGPAGGGGASEKLLAPRKDHPAAATFDRLDESWYRANIARLQDKLREEGIDAVLLTDRWNIIYFTGLFHTTTERPFAIFIPASGMDPTWFHPGLDRDLVGSWWIKDREQYFDFKHAAGGFPNEGRVREGDAVDLGKWMWKGIRKRGFAGKSVGVDATYDAASLAAVEESAPGTKVRKVSDICSRMRMVKTPEEIALTQRAINYWGRIQAFAGDLIL